MKRFEDTFAQGEVVQQAVSENKKEIFLGLNVEKEIVFSEDELNSYFDKPPLLEDEEISLPFLNPAEWNGCGGGFVVKKEFFESKYYSQEGLLWILDYLQSVQNKTVAEEVPCNNNLKERDDTKERYYNDFVDVDDNHGNMIDDFESRDVYDYDLSLQRGFVLENLLKVETDTKTVDSLINFLSKDYKSHVYTREVANALSHADVNYAAKKLLEMIRNDDVNENKHSEYKNDLTKIIYSLEFGNVKISNNGVKYLEKVYDLQEFNNPEYFVNRLTAKGDIGVFDENKILQKYFNIGDLCSEEQMIKPRVLDFVYETLFLAKENETPEECKEREKYLQEFKENYFGFYNENFYNKTGVRFNNFDFKEQGWFMLYYKHASSEKQDQLMQFIANYKEDGLKTFLSLEHGGQEMGEKILKIGEKFDQEIADKIFAKYAELVDFAQNSAEYMLKEFNVDDKSQSQKITENLLRRGKALLSVCADEDSAPEIIYQKLESIKAEIEIFKESFRLVKSSDEDFSLENINAIQLKIKSGTKLLQEKEVVERMKEIYLENYRDFPEEFKEKILESLGKKLANSQARFYTICHKGEIVAFNSFTPQEDGTVHFANFNVDPQYNYSKLGEAMMEASLDKESQENTIVAEAIEGLPIAETYLNKKGFQKVGETKVAGVTLINIRKEKSN